MIEYGGYKGQEDSYENFLYYPQESGLRYCFMDKEEFIKNKLDENLIYYKCDIGNEGFTLKNIIENIISKSNWTALDYRLITHDCQSFLCELVKLTLAELHAISSGKWDFPILRKDSSFRVLEVLIENAQKHSQVPKLFCTLSEEEKLYMSIYAAENKDELNKIISIAREIDISIIGEKTAKIPEFKIKKIERDMNQIHPTFKKKEFDINDKNEILNSYIDKFEIFYIKENNHEFVGCLIKCKYSHKLVLLNYGRNGCDKYLEADPYYKENDYKYLLYTYFFHDNDEEIRFCFVRPGIKSTTTLKNKTWSPKIKFIFPNLESNISIKSLLENCDRNGNWFSYDFNEKTNSGIHFVNLIIKLTKAIPNKWHYIYGHIYRNEKLLIKLYPRIIIDTIKENIENSM